MCFGALFVQVTIFFQQRRRIGKAQLFALLVILCTSPFKHPTSRFSKLKSVRVCRSSYGQCSNQRCSGHRAFVPGHTTPHIPAVNSPFFAYPTVFVYHLTDVAYLSTSFHRPIVVVGFYVSISLILCCQTFLLRRSFLFGQTFHLGNSKWRLAYLGLIACLVIVGACLGFVAQKELLDFKTLDDVIVRTREFQSEGL